MSARPPIAVLLLVSLALPARGDEPLVQAIGNVILSRRAIVQGVALKLGSTLFSGDTLQVSDGGEAGIALPGGSQARVFQNSLVRLSKSDATPEIILFQGGVMFRSLLESPVVVGLADAAIQGADGPAIGFVEIRGTESVYVAAVKGSLEIRASHDDSSLLLTEGKAATIPIAQEPKEENGRKKKRAGTTFWTTGHILLLTAAAITGIILAVWHPWTAGKKPCNQTTPVNCF